MSWTVELFFFISIYHKFVCAKNILQFKKNLPKSYLLKNIYHNLDIMKYIKYYYMRQEL